MTGIAAALFGMLLGRRAMAPLHQAIERQRRFVADASHELRTPLSRLALRADLLHRDLRSGIEPRLLAADAATLVRDAHSLASVMDDLPLSAQLDGDPRTGDFIDLARLISDVVDADRQRADQLQITLTASTSPVPPVRGVTVALSRVTAALVDNALRHTPAGGHIDVGVGREGPNDVLLAVRDSGPGIATSASADLFTRFHRGEDGRHGIGLSLVREVVEAHQGSIDVEALEPSGTRFVVRLPVADRRLPG
jgi:signal transduction histidine kinase